jgi:hypothetical protein
MGIGCGDDGKFPAQKFYTWLSARVPHLITIKNSRRDSGFNGIMKHANMHFMTTIKGLVALALVLAPVFAAADIVFKYQRPDGSIIYSNVPVRGAKLIGRFELVPVPPAPGVARDAPSSGGKDPADKRAEQRTQALDAAEARIKAAEQALRDAEERRQLAAEPLPGERQGTAGGRSRLMPEYFERQRAMEAEVDAARAGLDEAYRLRNQLR